MSSYTFSQHHKFLKLFLMFGNKPYPHCLSIHAHMVCMGLCTCTCGIYGCTYMHILTYVYPVPSCLFLTLKHHSFLNSACWHSMTIFSASKLNTQIFWRTGTKVVALKKPLPSHRQILNTESPFFFVLTWCLASPGLAK